VGEKKVEGPAQQI